MDRYDRYALDVAKEITIAKMSSAPFGADKTTGEAAAAFFEAVYRKIAELVQEELKG